MRILIELFLSDVLLATLHLASDIFLVYSYFHEDDPWWAGITLLAIGLPGLLGGYLVKSLIEPDSSHHRNDGLHLLVPSQRPGRH